MSFQATVFNVFIASPSDVDTERQRVREVLHEWNVIHADEKNIVLLPVGWETHSASDMSGPPQSVINRQALEKSDLLVGIFWTRIGTATLEYASGAVEEIERHIKANKPTMLFFSDAPINPGRIDNKQRDALEEFKEGCKSRGLYTPFSSTLGFEAEFRRQLAIRLKEPYFKSKTDLEFLVEQKSIIQEISLEAKSLLKEASKDRSGYIMKTRVRSGLVIQTNSRNFVEVGNPRSEAVWTSALDSLLKFEFVEAIGYKGESFKVTSKGYAVVDSLFAN